ncbi:peroxidase RIP1 [Hevea brasiliensis]|uniref:peroxidase RIP1 n=1 Tax=Hevea brasiliensis TaxID=3981 RepID=UPI0025CDB91B|nr:peroxidase RIP1 [Hevea brasiliensis]
MASRIFFCLWGYLLLVLPATASAALSPYYYGGTCPNALPTIKRVVEAAVSRERRMGASLLRLHFHDCFVNGCDASLLLDPSPTIDSEKNALPNANSTRGFEVIDQIKSEVDKACGRPVVSCADILAVAARDSVVALSTIQANFLVYYCCFEIFVFKMRTKFSDLLSPFSDLPELISGFKKHGLNEKDLVVLSGGHTLGFAQCGTFKNRTYNETYNINPNFAQKLRSSCPPNGGDRNLAPLDPTPARFDIAYFTNLKYKKGLLHSDQQLFSGGSTDNLVKTYSSNPQAFWRDFAKSMVKMGNIKPLTGNQGQVRLNCRMAN